MTRVLTGPALVLEGTDLLAVELLVSKGVRVLRERDGVTLPAQVLALVDQLNRTAAAYRAMSADGHRPADMPHQPPPLVRVPEAAAADVLTASEVAASLGMSTRHVTRLASDLGGVRHGRSWRFSRTAVEAFSTARAA